jgi:S-adenosylmethionine hydrolase
VKQSSIISFLSDFGTSDYYVGAVKGGILAISPDAMIIDISHEIEPQNIRAAAYVLGTCYSDFPSGTIHLAVVDPGVGSERRGLVVETSRFVFVAPDNGVLSLVLDKEEVIRAVSIQQEEYFRHPISNTFHGRDIFGPVSAWISKGVDCAKIGPSVGDLINLDLSRLDELEDDSIQGIVLHIDRFGNIVTSFDRVKVKLSGEIGQSGYFEINGFKISRRVSYYSEASEKGLVALVGSGGYYEISARNQSAAKIVGAEPGMRVRLVM